MSVKDFFFFDRMIAPILIKILFWLGLVVMLSVVASLLPARNASRLTIREVLAYE